MSRIATFRSAVVVVLAFAGLFGLAWLTYRPGLSGGFLFDDYSNLAILGYYGRVDNEQSLLLYLLSGFSGPSGRPLSMLSFLLDANTWPADPWPFKHTNVLIHLAVGAALALLVREITRALDLPRKRALGVVLLTTALWLLHPFWVSTTLYVVQRMAQLSALFVLLGLWWYLRCRLRNPRTLTVGAWWQSLVAIGGCGVLAVLAKENGALLPLFALVLEGTVLAAHAQATGVHLERAWKIWRALLLGLPVAALLLYMAQSLPALLHGDAGTRAFTPGERLLAQGPILWDYIAHVLLPHFDAGRLFNDDLHVPQAAPEVALAAVAWVALLALTVLALVFRTRRPALALAFLFFMAGQLLESSFLQLELYFEHRNYLPAALYGLPIALFLLRPGRLTLGTRAGLTAGVLLLLAALTTAQSNLWGKPFQLALTWARHAPESARAQHYLAGLWMETGNLAEADRLNRRAVALQPLGVPWRLRQVMIDCERRVDPTDSMAAVEQLVIETPRIGTVVREQFTQYLDFLLDASCDGHAGPRAALALIERIDRRRLPGALAAAIDQRAARAHLMLGEPVQAHALLRAGLRVMPDEGVLLHDAAMLAGYGQYALALVLLDDPGVTFSRGGGTMIDRLRRLYIERSGYYRHERTILRARIIEDMQTVPDKK